MQSNLTDNLYQSIVSSVYEVFDTMLGLDIEVKEEQILDFKLLEEDTLITEIFGLIGFTGELIGAIGVFLDNNLAKLIASTLLEEEVTELNEDVISSVAELTNMIAGGIKTALNSERDLFEIAIPIVIKNKDNTVPYIPKDCKVLSVPFTVKNSNLYVKFYLS